MSLVRGGEGMMSRVEMVVRVAGGLEGEVGLDVGLNWHHTTERSYLAVTASQIQHHLVSTLLKFHTSKLQKKIPNSELSA